MVCQIAEEKVKGQFAKASVAVCLLKSQKNKNHWIKMSKKKKKNSTNLHPWPHYKHSPPGSIMKICSGDFPRHAFMCYVMLRNYMFICQKNGLDNIV